MLFISEDQKRFICTTEDGSPCFMRRTHTEKAKALGLDLSKMDNLTFAFKYTGKGQSIKDFLNN